VEAAFGVSDVVEGQTRPAILMFVSSFGDVTTRVGITISSFLLKMLGDERTRIGMSPRLGLKGPSSATGAIEEESDKTPKGL
jgi:hypothetical protein